MRKRPPIPGSDLLSVLKAESESLAAEISVRMDRKAQVDALIATYEEKPRTGKRAVQRKAQPAKAAPTRRAQPQEDAPSGGLFYGKALPEACATQIKLAGKAQSTSEIWTALAREGYTITASNPQHAVHWSLRRRENTVGDIMLVGKGRWDLCDRYTPEARDAIRVSLGAMDGRDHESHVEKTKRGIENVRANGVRWGGPIRVTEEVKAKLIHLRLDEKRSVAEACAAVGIAQATYYHRPDNGKSAYDVVKKAKEERKAAQQKNEKKSADAPDLLTSVAGNA